MQKDTEVDREAWHLSKSVPLAFVLTLVLQTVVLVSWAATFKAEFVAFRDQTTNQLETLHSYVDAKTVDRVTGATTQAQLQLRDQRIESIEKRSEQVFSDLQRLDSLIRNRMDRIEVKLDKHNELNHPNGRVIHGQ